jgi:AcrR family transcriptional regulator
MTAEPLTRERILEAAEDVLRRYGPAKANVVDVARALGVSHGSVYRHFESKAALRDAVTARWLESISQPLEAVASDEGAAAERLQRWLDRLVASKRAKALEEPELFATYVELAADARDVVGAHVDTLVGQLARIIADGVAQGVFAVDDPQAAARATFDATGRFHNPAHAAEWSDPRIGAAYEAVAALVLRGLRAPAHGSRPGRRPAGPRGA